MNPPMKLSNYLRKSVRQSGTLTEKSVRQAVSHLGNENLSQAGSQAGSQSGRQSVRQAVSQSGSQAVNFPLKNAFGTVQNPNFFPPAAGFCFIRQLVSQAVRQSVRQAVSKSGS